MKRLLKILAAAALILSFSAMFTGCDALDAMKDKHAKLSEGREKISFQGETFFKLPEGIPYYFNDTYSNKINVTEVEVPVLLSEEFGYRGYYDSLKEIIAVRITAYDEEGKTLLSVPYIAEEDLYTYYTTEEKFEAYSQLTMDDADRIGFPHIGYSYGTAILSRSASEEIIGLIDEADSSNWTNEAFEYALNNYSDNIYRLVKCTNMPMALRGSLNGYELYIIDDGEVYLTKYYSETGVKLSEDTADDIIEKLYSR